MRNLFIRIRNLILLVCLIGIDATVSAEPSKPLSERTLAEEIVADQNMKDVHQMACKLLKTGLTAGSGYGEVWIRDLNTFIELALEVNEPGLFRESLLTFFKLQGETGDIVDGYIP